MIEFHRSFFLACRQFNSKKTAANIAEKLLEIFQEFKIEEKVWLVLTDSAANMIKMESDLNKLYYTKGKVIV